jgi:hypothetical protein
MAREKCDFLRFRVLYLLGRRINRTLRMSVLESEMQSGGDCIINS